eukprot:GCRY01001857.1.p1 GENE.GCRY01001857.1~~GCRY01001857.1.p1  ORF type:complete len:337 (-),score=36.54 GCRY01001857.1:24-1034(-)
MKATWDLLNVSGPKPEPREAHCSVLYENKVVVFGGGQGPAQLGDVAVLNLETKKWEFPLLSGSVPPKRTGACAFAWKEFMYIFGGLNTESGFGYLPFEDVCKINLKTFECTVVKAQGDIPSPRDKVACALCRGKLTFFGGFGPTQSEASDDEDPAFSFKWFNDLFVFDFDKCTFQELHPLGEAPTPRAAHAASVCENKLYIFGGRDQETRQGDLHALNLDTLEWSGPLQCTGITPTGRSFHTLSTFGNRLVLLGGLSNNNQHLEDICVFDTVSSEWTQFGGANAPIGRGFFTTECLRGADGGESCELLLFGGSSGFDPNSGPTIYHNTAHHLQLTQ